MQSNHIVVVHFRRCVFLAIAFSYAVVMTLAEPIANAQSPILGPPRESPEPVQPIGHSEIWASGKVGDIAVNSQGWLGFHLVGFPKLCNNGAGNSNDWVQLTTNYMSIDEIKQVLAVVTAAKLSSRMIVIQGQDNFAADEWSCRFVQITLK
jgi:hypothetical protein